jgi:hypothetical protein
MFIFHEMILIWYVVDSVCLLKALHCFFNQQFANNKSLSVFYAKRRMETIDLRDAYDHDFVAATRCDDRFSQAKVWNSKQRKRGWPSTNLSRNASKIQ